jgi:hypothetical protein
MGARKVDMMAPGKTANVTGNFDLGTFFGDVKCVYWQETRLFNIGRGHYVACDECRTYLFVGSNLMSNWRQENRDVWQRNYDSINGYKEGRCRPVSY